MSQGSQALQTAMCTLADTRKGVEIHLANNYKKLAIYTFLTILGLGILGFCLYKIALLIIFYSSQKKKMQERMKPKSNNALNPSDDDDKTKSSADDSETALNDYKTYTQNIQKSVDEYKSYNENLKKFYSDNRPGEQPQDLMDTTFIDPSKDNY